MRETLLANYPLIKGLHIVAVVAWMAGMMYLPRLFVYHHQAIAGGEAERLFILMERRLLRGIVNPAMIAVWVLGAVMLYAQPAQLSSGWFLVKLAAVVAISGFHGAYAGARRRFERGERPRSERFWRIMNEAPFALMIVAALLAMTKPF